METYHKIQTLFKRDLDGSITGQKGKMIKGEWTTNELKYLAGNQWEFTEKVDGTNIRIGFGQNGETPVCFAGRSDRAVIPASLLEYLESTFTMKRMEQAEVGTSFILFGEGYGPKIQKGGGNYRGDVSFVLFDVKIGDFWLTRPNVDDIARKLGIDSVPVVGYGTLNDAIHMVSGWNYIDNVGCRHEIPTMRSTWGDFEAEGIVARPSVPMFDRKGQRIITKIKAVDFK